jgi:hypothetical protein
MRRPLASAVTAFPSAAACFRILAFLDTMHFHSPGSRTALCSPKGAGTSGICPGWFTTARTPRHPQELKTASQIAAEELSRPEIGREHERTALAHSVAVWVIRCRMDHGRSQIGLAHLRGMHQPRSHGWRQETTRPSRATLSRLARVLGIEFNIDMTPDALVQRESAWAAERSLSRSATASGLPDAATTRFLSALRP